MKNRKSQTAGLLMSLLVLFSAVLAYPAGASAAGKEPGAAQAGTGAPIEPAGTLVFQTTYGGTFYTINVDGTNLQPVTNGIDPVWSPDGDQIAFVRWEEPRGVWVIDVGTGDEWRVFDWSETRYPAWSPAGDEIVFSRQNGGRTEEKERCFRGRCVTLEPDPHWTLGTVSTGDGAFAEPLPNSDVSLAPDWSPGGDQVVFDGVHGLQVQSADGQTSYQLTTEAHDTSPIWSPDGQQVAFVRRQHDHWEVYVINTDGSNLTRLTDTPTLPDGTTANSVSPAWSPDGNTIAFLTDRAGEWEIWVTAAPGGMEADGVNQGRLFDTELDGLTLEYAFHGERAISWTD